MDYKITTKCLAERLKRVIDKLIDKSQFGFIKGRNIKEALRTVLYIVDDTNKKQKQGMMITIDGEKAFDSLSWNSLFKTL